MVRLVLSVLLLVALSACTEAGRVGSTKTDLHLRARAGTGDNVLFVIPGGADLRVYRCSGPWCYVRFAETSGYASAQHITMDVPGRPYDSTRAATIAESADIRKGPGESFDPASLTVSTSVGVYACRNGWCFIRGARGRGYIAESALQDPSSSGPSTDG